MFFYDFYDFLHTSLAVVGKPHLTPIVRTTTASIFQEIPSVSQTSEPGLFYFSYFSVLVANVRLARYGCVL